MASTNRTAKTPGAAPAAVPVDPVPGSEPDTDERVRVAAYFIYQNNGCRQGHALEDWVAAQAQLGIAAAGEGGSPEPTPKA